MNCRGTSDVVTSGPWSLGLLIVPTPNKGTQVFEWNLNLIIGLCISAMLRDKLSVFMDFKVKVGHGL